MAAEKPEAPPAPTTSQRVRFVVMDGQHPIAVTDTLEEAVDALAVTATNDVLSGNGRSLRISPTEVGRDAWWSTRYASGLHLAARPSAAAGDRAPTKDHVKAQLDAALGPLCKHGRYLTRCVDCGAPMMNAYFNGVDNPPANPTSLGDVWIGETKPVFAARPWKVGDRAVWWGSLWGAPGEFGPHEASAYRDMVGTVEDVRGGEASRFRAEDGLVIDPSVYPFLLRRAPDPAPPVVGTMTGNGVKLTSDTQVQSIGGVEPSYPLPTGPTGHFLEKEMVRGLVRAAELLESRQGGRIWDDDARRALMDARAMNLAKALPEPEGPSPDEPTDLQAIAARRPGIRYAYQPGKLGDPNLSPEETARQAAEQRAIVDLYQAEKAGREAAEALLREALTTIEDISRAAGMATWHDGKHARAGLVELVGALRRTGLPTAEPRNPSAAERERQKAKLGALGPNVIIAKDTP